MNSSTDLKKTVRCDDKDVMRQRNCLRRDFTINGLFIKPFLIESCIKLVFLFYFL